MDWKYIIFEGAFNLEYPLIFPPFVSHSSIKDVEGKAISAGFVKFSNGKLKAYGKSDSLKLRSRPEDSLLLNKLLENIKELK